MVVADPPSSVIQVGPSTRAAEALLGFISAVGAVSPVQQVRYTVTGGVLTLWVLMPSEDLEANRRIFLLERDYRRTPEPYPLKLNIVTTDTAGEERDLTIPPSRVLPRSS